MVWLFSRVRLLRINAIFMIELRHLARYPQMPVESSNFEFLEPPQSDDELGRIGPYRVLNLIGEGGMGAL